MADTNYQELLQKAYEATGEMGQKVGRNLMASMPAIGPVMDAGTAFGESEYGGDLADYLIARAAQTRLGGAAGIMAGATPEFTHDLGKMQEEDVMEKYLSNRTRDALTHLTGVGGAEAPPAAPVTPTTPAQVPVRKQPLTARFEGENGDRVVFGNNPDVPSEVDKTEYYEGGLEAWKNKALIEQGDRPDPVAPDIPEEVTVVPQMAQNLDFTSPEGRAEAFREKNSTVGGTGASYGGTGDFKVRPGRGGFTPSAQVPTPGTLSEEEINNLAPGVQDLYKGRLGEMRQRQAEEYAADPGARFRTAEAKYADDPGVQAQLAAHVEAVRNLLAKSSPTGEADPALLQTLAAAKLRALINERIMEEGAGMAALEPKTYMKSGIPGIGI